MMPAFRPIILTICVAAAFSPTTVIGQAPAAKVGVVARVGWGASPGTPDVSLRGLEIEAGPRGTMVPAVRLQVWDFGTKCPDSGSCPGSLSVLTLGAKIRASSKTRGVPYMGGDAGYMAWNSGAKGLAAGVRGGVDVHIIGHLDINMEVNYTNLRHLWNFEPQIIKQAVTAGSVAARVSF